MTGPNVLRLLGVDRQLLAPGDWNREDWPKLWLYNAHYFDDLAATDADARRAWHAALMERWILENPPAQGAGWEPYPTSLRLVNWVKSALSRNHLSQAARHSLAVQARYLGKRLEMHLLGNHLWANAKALLFAGAFFDGDEAGAWRATGLAILRRELAEQILPDGGHFERSPMYHALLLEDLLDLVQLAAMYPGLFADGDVSRWCDSALRMHRWLRVMSHPDGGIALFNDAALDVAPDVAALAQYAHSVGVSVDEAPLSDLEALPESGYVRLQAGSAVLIADVAPLGPDYLPGHAHADTLSFELSLHGTRALVNGGTSTYEAGAERLRQRGTAMHNTVQVDGADSSEVWSSFRVARRARPLDVRWGHEGGTLWIEAGHDGYRRLPGKVLHRRRWELKPGSLRVVDVLSGRYAEARAHFRIAPGLPGEQACANNPVVQGGTSLRWTVSGGTPVTIVPGTWHPRFGVDEVCRVLVVPVMGSTLETTFHWS